MFPKKGRSSLKSRELTAEIIAVGTELLLGAIVNTNAAYLSRKLASIGINVYYQTTVGDNPERIQAAIRLALSRSDIVITSGGLGPTVDDITLPMIAKAIGRPMVFKKCIMDEIKKYFRARGINRITCNVERQAYMPEGAVCFINTVGTAAGVAIHAGKAVIIALPGPPRELEPMFDSTIIPYLRKKGCAGTGVIKTRTIQLTGIFESAVDSRAKDLLELSGSRTVGIYSKPGMVELKITAKAKSAREAEKKIKPVELEIRKRFGDFIFGTDGETLEQVVGRSLAGRGLTIAMAESCTGGLIGHRLTEVSGSSRYFVMGVVSYSNPAKKAILNVKHETLARHGAVSREVAREMALGIRAISGADIGLAVTGIAGPTGGTTKKPVGLVYIALSSKGRTQIRECRFTGDRSSIKWRTSSAALDLIRRSLK
ncbi:MAG: competence/damage-inducible protein A [Candidatus Omnitrophica bacterium]|nr:competence/damage-inducible protein A [Candidatus Omnitrophota bacterium]